MVGANESTELAAPQNIGLKFEDVPIGNNNNNNYNVFEKFVANLQDLRLQGRILPPGRASQRRRLACLSFGRGLDEWEGVPTHARRWYTCCHEHFSPVSLVLTWSFRNAVNSWDALKNIPSSVLQIEFSWAGRKSKKI